NDSSSPLFSLLFGIDTPAAEMPVSGQATFSGSVRGIVGPPEKGADLYGSANFLADFASGKITGAFSKMTYYTGAGTSSFSGPIPWNDVSAQASIAAGTNRFSGSTAVTSAPSTPLSLSG